MIDENALRINALKNVIDYLHREEPKCGPCEQCWYGYKFDEESKQKCKERQEEKQHEHLMWERRYNYWKKELDNAE